jgi:ubiquitin conjugation factor E4 B
MADAAEWGRLTEEEQSMITSRLDDNEREVRHALPLCNKTMQMFGYLNTDEDIRSLFLLPELYPRLVNMLNHVLQKIVGGKGLDLKVRITFTYVIPFFSWEEAVRQELSNFMFYICLSLLCCLDVLR